MNLKPMPGRAFIKLDPEFRDSERIVLVGRTAKRKTTVGVVTQISLYPEGVKHKTAVKDKRGMEVMRARDQFIYNDIYKDLVGKKVIIEDGVGQEIDEDTFSIRLEHIHVIIPNDVICKPADGEMPRCPRCKSTGIANIIMTKRNGQYVCPICNMTTEGDRVEDLDLGSNAALSDMMNPEKRVKKGTVYSYKGQGKR